MKGPASADGRAVLDVSFFQTNFSTPEHKTDIKRDQKMKEFSNEIKSVFEGLLILELYPKSQIDLQIFVLESDGGARSAAFNAATLALVDAGIPMRDFLVSSTSGLLGQVPVLDLILSEEKKQNCEFVVCHESKSQKIAFLSLSCNKLKSE